MVSMMGPGRMVVGMEVAEVDAKREARGLSVIGWTDAAVDGIGLPFIARDIAAAREAADADDVDAMEGGIDLEAGPVADAVTDGARPLPLSAAATLPT